MNLFEVKLASKMASKNNTGTTTAVRKVKRYELIETITITKDGITAVERTAEPDGTPYDFEKLIYTIECEPAASTSTGWISINDLGNYGYSSAMIGTSKTFLGGSVQIENGRLTGTFCAERSSISTMGAVRNYGHGIGTNEADKIEKIRFLVQNTSSFPIGSVITIHAVRN